MAHADFVHLHNHSDYSLLDGASPIPRMVARAAELGMPAVALTDHGSMFGAVEFYQEARKVGVKPIIGMEAYVTRGKRSDRTKDTSHHLVLLARDEQGFKNLIKLSSLAFLEGFYYRPRVDHELLSRHAAGLTALSACPKGEVATDLLAGDMDGAIRTATMYRDLFGAEHYFLEVQNHGIDIEAQIREGVRSLSRATGIPIVATNDCHYLKHEDADAHDVLLCIQTGKTVTDTNRLRYTTDQVYFKSADEMRQRFDDFPGALANTLLIAEQCDLKLQFGRPLLPEFPLPEGWTSADAFLQDLTWQELNRRFPGGLTEAIRERAAYELDVLSRMGFASYFLIVRDFIHFARSNGIGVGPGRGSVAGSLVAYALRITDVNPLEHGLIFERFLNPERVSMPDIDIDFDDLRRGEVIEYVKQKYGEGSVTQIITFGTMGAKGVVRDVGRALGLAYADVDRVAKLVPDGLGMTLDRALELSPDLKGLPQRGPEYDRLLRSARALEGLARHASTHAAGVLITPGPLLDYVPLYRQKDDSITTQWDMKAVEKAGLLKMDFLGLRTLSVLDECVQLVRRHHGVELKLDELPLDDARAYEVFQRADTVAIFQFESSGMRDYLRRLKPTVFNDLVAMNALYRPGPMENIPYFIDCKHGRQKARFDHPALEPILKDTYGVFVYQEQVMAAANALAGFSMAQADELRRAMGKKLPEEMEKKRAQFVEGCKTKSIPAKTAEKIFQTMEKFAGYGFNRCVVGETQIVDAESGEGTTVGDLFRSKRPFTIHALGEDWKLRPRRVLDVMWNGRKPVFEVRVSGGRHVTATGNHPFRTREGWKRLDDLRPGDIVAVACEWANAEDRSRSDARAHGRHSVGHPGGVELAWASATVAEMEPAASEVCWDPIVSIEPHGIQDTYDLTVEHDHNFVANGIVVHNSHSCAYALLAYQCAYLKANWPAEFMAATLTSELSDSARIATLIEECRRMKLDILPPDVNRSEWKFTLEDSRIRYAMGAVRNVGQSHVEAIVAARESGYADLYDLAHRVDPRVLNRRVLESLVGAGACDSLGLDRATLHAGAERVLNQASALHRERESGQSSLFGDGGNGAVAVATTSALPPMPPWSDRERSVKEKEALGFYLTDHPLAPMRAELDRVATHKAVEALELEDGSEVRLAGLVGEVKPLVTKTGRRMAVVTLEDLSGRIECTVFPDTFDQCKDLIVPDQAVVMVGRIEARDERGVKVLVGEMRGLEAARATYRGSLQLEVRAEALSQAWLDEVDAVLTSHPGECDVYLHIIMPDRSRQVSRARRYRVAEGDDVVRSLTARLPTIQVSWTRGGA